MAQPVAQPRCGTACGTASLWHSLVVAQPVAQPRCGTASLWHSLAAVVFISKCVQCHIAIRKEGNVLFNDVLNTFFIYSYMALDI